MRNLHGSIILYNRSGSSSSKYYIVLYVQYIIHCILYNRSKHTEMLLVTANEQFIQQIALNLDLKPESDLYVFK